MSRDNLAIIAGFSPSYCKGLKHKCPKVFIEKRARQVGGKAGTLLFTEFDLCSCLDDR